MAVRKKPNKKAPEAEEQQQQPELFEDVTNNDTPPITRVGSSAHDSPGLVDEPEPSDNGKAESADPFDPANLRLDPNTQAGAIGVKRQILSLKVDKPDKMEFCRVHPDEAYRIDTAIIRDKVNREAYIVAPALWPELPDFITPVRICAAVNRHGSPFLWPATLPDPSGRANNWHESMLEAQELAVKDWVRVQADMHAGSYAVFVATGNLPEPEWPDLTFKQMLELGFKKNFIGSMDHPFLRELFGQV